MRKLRNFKCPEHGTQERLVQDDVKNIKCLKCDLDTQLEISAGKYLGNTTGKSPSL